MAFITPKDPSTVPELSQVFAMSESIMGFVPNSMTTMAHMPQLAMAFSMLAGVTFGSNLKDLVAAYQDQVPELEDPQQNLPPDLIQLIAFSVSSAAGCRYCQAHTSNNLVRFGGVQDKLGEVFRHAESTLLSPAEKAAVALAFAAGAVPNECEQLHFDALREHFNDRQIVQIVGVVALFGFLNRWNDTMATALEAHPIEFAQQALTGLGWQAGKHSE